MSAVTVHPAVIASAHEVAALQNSTGMSIIIDHRTGRAHLREQPNQARTEWQFFVMRIEKA